MKLTMLMVVMVGSAFGAQPLFYETQCTECLEKQVLEAVSVVSNGGYMTNVMGTNVSVTTRSGNFHCKVCHADFVNELEPKVVPKFVATPVREKKEAFNNEAVVKFSDGSSLVISTNNTDGTSSGIVLKDGTVIYLSHKK